MTWTAIDSGIRLALANTRQRKMRSFLTVLGVIIGTGAVIGVGSIVVGLDGAITGVIRSFGPNTIIVFKWKDMHFGNLTAEERRRKPLSLENARAIRDRCPAVEQVSPYLFPERGVNRARYRNNDIYGVDLGGTEEGYAFGGTVMKYGRFFDDMEGRHRLPITVIGEGIQKSLFPNIDPVGKWLQVNGHSVQIVGVMQRPSASFPGNDDLRVLLPYLSMRKMFPNAKEHMLVISAQPGMLAQAMDQVQSVLRIERHVENGKPDNFAMSTAEQMIEEFRNITSTVAMVMIALSSIGLLVGGIGVMNIMLVSVTERTREIGIRKAVGARRGDIVLQFLTEAVVLTGLGGAIGLLLGYLVSVVVGMIFSDLPTAVPLWAAAAGILVSVGVGLFFGIWPASRAARLDPVEALRYE